MDAESEGRIRVSYLVADGEKCNLVRYLEPDGLPATLYQLAVRVGIDVERLAAEAEQEVRTKHGARAKGITKLIVHALAELWPKLASALPPPRAPELGGFVLHPLAAIKRRRTAAGKAGPPSGAGPPEGLKPSAKAQARSAALSTEPGCASSVAGGLYEPYASWAQVDADWSEDVKSLLSLIGGGISAGGSDSGGGSAGGGDAGGGGAGDGDAGGGSAGGGDAGGGGAGGGDAGGGGAGDGDAGGDAALSEREAAQAALNREFSRTVVRCGSTNAALRSTPREVASQAICQRLASLRPETQQGPAGRAAAADSVAVAADKSASMDTMLNESQLFGEKLAPDWSLLGVLRTRPSADSSLQPTGDESAGSSNTGGGSAGDDGSGGGSAGGGDAGGDGAVPVPIISLTLALTAATQTLYNS